jgi:hypothetical protein
LIGNGRLLFSSKMKFHCVQATANNVKVGDRLIPDGGFTCMTPGHIKVVRRDEGRLYVKCEDGCHYLDGQLDEHGRLIGFQVRV